MSDGPTYSEVLTAAVADVAARGYVSEEQIAHWEAQLRAAAERSLKSVEETERLTREAMAAIYAKLVDRGGILKHHKGVGRYTLDKVRPQLHAELSRRIAANAGLIKSNREEAIAKTLRRFRGWSTSVPAGGAPTDRQETKTEIRKSLSQLGFQDRRVRIDQSAKLFAAINQTVAEDNAAIGLIWHSHWRAPGYNYREDHKERDGLFYMLRGSWALEKGLVKPGPAGYYDQVTAVAQEPFCRCFAGYLYSLRDIPDASMTALGRETLRIAREKVRAL